MKKIILLILVVLILSGCDMALMNEWSDISGTPDLSEYTEQEIYDFVLQNIKYSDYANGYQEVQKTWDEKRGNCCNRALLTLALIYKYKHVKEKLLSVSIYKDYTSDHTFLTGIREHLKIKQIWETIEFDNIGTYIQIYKDRQ